MENTRKAEIIKAIRLYDNKGLPEAVKIYNALSESEKQAYYMRYDRYKNTLRDRRCSK